MSVMQQLQQLSQEGGDFRSPQFNIGTPEESSELEASLQASPIIGQSLTQDPEQRLPFEQPPEFTDLQEFMEHTFVTITEEGRLETILDTMRRDVPVEDLAEQLLQGAFQQGKISPDLLMLAIEPTIYLLISLATYADIDPVLYPEDDMLADDSDATDLDGKSGQAALFRKAADDLMKEDAMDDGKLTVEDLQAPAAMPRSLLARSEEAVKKTMGGGDVAV